MENSTREDGFDLAPVLRALWRRKLLIAIVTLLAAAAAFALTLQEPHVYSATALIKPGRIWNDPVEDAYALAEIINSSAFLNRVNERLANKRNAEALTRALSAEKLEGGRARARYVYLLRISARGATPAEATELIEAAVAEVLARGEKSFNAAIPAYAERERRLQERIAAARAGAELLALERELADAELNNSSPLRTHKTELAEEIEPPKLMPRANALKRTAVGGAAGFALAVLAALALELVIPRVSREGR